MRRKICNKHEITHMKLLSGKIIQEEMRDSLKEKVADFSVPPELVIIQVGENTESEVYIRQKKKFGEAIGVPVRHMMYPENVSEAEIIATIESCNTDATVSGIIVQLPLPKHLSRD